MSDPILFDVVDTIATVTLNRPEKLNAFTDGMLFDLVACLDECEEREDVRVVVLTGAGRAFCAGGDVSAMGAATDNTPAVTKRHINHAIQAFPRRAHRFDKPLIAAINGVATGGGLDLALACDIRLAAASARFAETYVSLGLLPGGGGAWYLPRLVGSGMALEMLLSGDFIDAESAARIGLVNHVYPDAALLPEATKLAARIASRPPLSVRLIKRTVHQGLECSLETALDLVSSHIAIAKSGPDHAEAIRAFREKREGSYTGS